MDQSIKDIAAAAYSKLTLSVEDGKLLNEDMPFSGRDLADAIIEKRLYFKINDPLKKAKFAEFVSQYEDRGSDPRPKILHRVATPVRSYLIKLLESKKARETEREMTSGKGEIIRAKLKFKDLVPIFDISKETKDVQVYNTQTQQITKMNGKLLLDSVTKEQREVLMQKALYGKLTYEPFVEDPYWYDVQNGEEVAVFNLYQKPEWAFIKKEKAVKVDLFEDFMHHLYIGKECRTFIYNWMLWMIKKRNQTVLLLNGQKGIGKGVFAEICRNLVGESNYQLVGDSFFRSRFNAEAENKRLMFVDEVPIKDSYNDNIKFMCNDTIPIEKKGKDVEGNTRNHASFIVSNNYIYENYIDLADRRISVPEITETPVLKVFSESDIEHFMSQFQSPEGARWIVNFLYENETDQTPFSVWKGEKFWTLCFEGMEQWKKFTVEYIEANSNPIKYVDLKDIYEVETGFRTMPSAEKLGEFLKNFKDREGNQYAKLVRDENKVKTIVPIGIYGEEEEEFEI